MAAVRIIGNLSQHVEGAVVLSDLSDAILDGLQGRLFSRLRQHHQERERLRLIVTYRRQFLDALLRQGEEKAEQVQGLSLL